MNERAQQRLKLKRDSFQLPPTSGTRRDVSTRGAHLRAAEGAPPGNMAHVDITPPGTATPPSLVPDTVFFKSHNHSTYLHSTYLVSPASASSAHDSHPTMDPLHIYILSDSSGETAAHIIKAAVAQFPSRSVCVHRLAPVTHSRQIHELLANIIHRPALIAYTFVVPELQETLVNAALTTDDLHLIDLIGPLIESVAHHTNKIPLHQPRRRHVLDSAYFQRMEAVNFSVQFDDGKVHDALHRADVVLVGLSRTSKTPSCMYLAQHYSLKAANIPLVPGTDVPKAIYSVDPQRIIGLTINADHLYSLRLHRAQHMGLSVRTDYSNYDSIREEMQYATSFFREVGCQVINVTNRAIEETAAEIVRRLENAGCLLFLTETG